MVDMIMKILTHYIELFNVSDENIREGSWTIYLLYIYIVYIGRGSKNIFMLIKKKFKLNINYKFYILKKIYIPVYI